MPNRVVRRVVPVRRERVTFEDAFWWPRLEANRTVSLRESERHCRETGRIDAFRLDWRPGQDNPPHIFWDSDVAKWLESCAYTLACHPDPELARRVEEVVELVVAAQQPDGYLNVHFTVVEPERRWTNLRDLHELYCAGHLMEAAVAYYEATGSRRLLEALCRYADYIATVFGTGPGQKRGYPGHQEIELALVKLYRATGEQRYLELSRYFVEERGRQPHYYDEEARARGEDPGPWQAGRYAYNQSHLPIREQTSAEGHAVRAMYYFSGATDVAMEYGDETLWAALRRLWDNVTQARMYVTGGIGSSAHGERFTTDFDLPNDTAYAETCAAIGLVFWAHRMAQVEPDRRYVDVLERALYNGVLSGVSLDGARFFYENLLRVNPRHHRGRFPVERQPWFGCACCPTNLTRLLASLGDYVYGVGENTLYVHLYAAGQVVAELSVGAVNLRQITDYPWSGNVRIEVVQAPSADWTLALRLPGWCRSPVVAVNGEAVNAPAAGGYATISRVWRAGDAVHLDLPMPIERVTARAAVSDDAGRVALQRGPLVYCLEEVDNGADLEALSLPWNAELTAAYRPDLLGGVTVIEGQADRLRDRPELYAFGPVENDRVPFVAVPYALWGNRGVGEMIVWLRAG